MLQPDGKLLVVAGTNSGFPKLVRLGADGSPDATFRADLTGLPAIGSIAVQPADGRVLVAAVSTTGNGVLLRLNPDGSVDGSFPRGEANGGIRAVALQPDGRIIVSGNFSRFNGEEHKNFARLNPDGSLDASLAPVTGGGISIDLLVVQPDGRILLGGNFSNFNGSFRNSLARLRADGSLDESFDHGSDLKIVIVKALALQPDGRVLVLGDITLDGMSYHNALGRLNADGTPDRSFPILGSIEFFNTKTSVAAVTVQPDGKLVVAGGIFSSGGGGQLTRVRIARLNPDGSLDPTFDAGLSLADVTSNVLLALPDGRLVAGGDFVTFADRPANGVVRLRADGQLDDAFRADAAPGPNAPVRGIIPLPRARSVIVGAFSSVGDATRFGGLAQLDARGAAEPGFVSATQPADVVAAAARQADGKLVIVGRTLNADSGLVRFILRRLNADGSEDRSGFQPDLTAAFGSTPLLACVALQPDGRILVGGYFRTSDGAARNHLVRLNYDGSVDPSFDAGDGGGAVINAVAVQPDGKILVRGGFTKSPARRAITSRA